MARNTFGGYTNVTEIVSAAAKTQILAQIDKLRDLTADVDNKKGGTPHTDFDHLTPALASQFRAEIAALKAAISAAPVV